MENVEAVQSFKADNGLNECAPNLVLLKKGFGLLVF